MLNFAKKLFTKKKEKSLSFFDLPADKQKKIIKKAVREANKDQLNLMKDYEKSLKFRNCSH